MVLLVAVFCFVVIVVVLFVFCLSLLLLFWMGGSIEVCGVGLYLCNTLKPLGCDFFHLSVK